LRLGAVAAAGLLEDLAGEAGGFGELGLGEMEGFGGFLQLLHAAVVQHRGQGEAGGGAAQGG
jgi:hypothetical protein